MTQHASLPVERWASFSLDQQVLMIANEMHRATKLLEPQDDARRRSAYERVLNLTDLTIRVHARASLRREMLRWRDLVALLYLAPQGDPVHHSAALRCLLRFTPGASEQLRHLRM